MYFGVNEFAVGVNDSIFSGIEQQKVYIHPRNGYYTKMQEIVIKVVVIIVNMARNSNRIMLFMTLFRGFCWALIFIRKLWICFA